MPDSKLAEAVPVKGIRALIARRMGDSLREMAQLTLHREVDTGQLTSLRETSDLDERPSINTLLLSAVARVLPQHPAVNATLQDDTIFRWKSVHLGMAVALDDGLVVPVIRNANQLSLAELQAQAARLASAAREGKLTMPDIEGATFTVTNLGAFGVDAFTPIIDPPQVAILGVGRIRKGAMTLSLTIDHRALDGAPGARFLADLAAALESPAETP
jgi:pyruvate dehydrogenase E2 component (dihydrolipoamide acetyltransferase)